MSEKRFENLPKWAREQIRSLERRIENLENGAGKGATFEECHASAGESDIYLQGLDLDGAQDCYVRNRSIIVYKVGTRKSDTISVSHRGDRIRVSSVTSNMAGVAILPEAGNVVSIKLQER